MLAKSVMCLLLVFYITDLGGQSATAPVGNAMGGGLMNPMGGATGGMVSLTLSKV